jgi:hypothetical protein
MKAIWIRDDLLHDPEIPKLADGEFLRLLCAALNGEKNLFSKYITFGDQPPTDDQAAID